MHHDEMTVKLMERRCNMSAEKRSTNTILEGLTIVLVLFRRSNSTGTIVSSRCDMSCIGNSTSTIAYNSTGTIVIANADSECCEG